MVCPSFWGDYFMFIYIHFWELMNSMGSHGSLSLSFVMKVMVCHFVSNLHEIMITFIVMLPLIIVVEIYLQLHQAFSSVLYIFYSLIPSFRVYPQMQSIGPIIHYSSCTIWFLVSICAICVFCFVFLCLVLSMAS
jgi:hypothetical protein